MNKTKLTTESIEIINQAKIISGSIFEIYTHLANLENNNQQDSEEYKRTLERLNSSIKLESNIISRLFENPNQTIIAILELDKNTNSDDGIEMIVNNSTERLINRRISEILRIYVLNNPEQAVLSQIDLTIPKEIKEMIELADPEEIKSMLKEPTAYYICEKLTKIDFTTLQLILLNSKIKSEYDKSLKSELTTAKYYTIFITPILEEELLENLFRIPTELYTGIYMLAKHNGVKREILDDYLYSFKNSVYNYEMNNLFSEKFETKAEIELREVRIRTALTLFTEEELMEENEKFHEIVDEINDHYFNTIIEAVTHAFKSFNYDRTLIKKVTIGN